MNPNGRALSASSDAILPAMWMLAVLPSAASRDRERIELQQRSAPGPQVFLIGAGPGDPELLTRKGARILASADTVVFDHLVGEGVLDLLQPEASGSTSARSRVITSYRSPRSTAC